MNPIEQAIEVTGSQAALASSLGVKQPTISEWLRGGRPIPPVRSVQIERATGGHVMRWHLRPDDWRDIWPELADRPDAPAATPTPTQEPTHG